MSRPSTPQLKTLDLEHRKPIQPGPNSWAQSTEKPNLMRIQKPGPATNRDKYENKPMPPVPRTPQHGPASHTPGKSGYIQPATPLIYTKQNAVKARSATDPVAPKPLFVSSKVSIGELQRKFSGNRDKTNTASADANARSRTPVPSELPSRSPENGDPLGTYQKQPPASAPLPTTATDAFQPANSPVRQHQPSPSPVLHDDIDDQVPKVRITQTSADGSGYENSVDSIPKFKNADGFIKRDGKLNPTRQGTYGTVGEVQYVEGRAVHRVASFAGIIENAECPSESDDRSQPPSTHTASSSGDTFRGQDLTYLLQPKAYSPSAYGGVWENDPQVGHTLPPFSPMPPRLPWDAELHHKHSSDGSRGTVPMNVNEPLGRPGRFPAYPPSVLSTNSWAPQTQDQLDPPLSATVPPLFSNPENHVPPPPRTYRDYQPPSGPLPAELARLELALHHHIDSCFSSLTRLVNGKHDQTADQLLTRVEDQDRRNEKALKTFKGDVQEIKRYIEIMKVDSKELQQSSHGLHGCLKDITANTNTVDEKLSNIMSRLDTMDQSLTELHSRVREVGSMCEVSAGQVGRQSVTSEYLQQHDGVSPTRSQSTYPSPALPSQRQQYQSNTSRSSGSGRQGSTGRRSNTTNGGAGSQNGDGRSSRRAYYAEVGATTGEPPDLRQHPAFASQQPNYGYDMDGMRAGLASDGMLHQMPSLTGHGPNGWYQQAYGQH